MIMKFWKRFLRWLFDRNKLAWSEYFKSYIKCVHYIDDEHWYFADGYDLDNRNVMKAGTRYSYFKWENIDIDDLFHEHINMPQ